MVRQVRAYLLNVNITENESELNKMSLQCEAASGTSLANLSFGPVRCVILLDFSFKVSCFNVHFNIGFSVH